jgi:CheY-like chemotaxis protein
LLTLINDVLEMAKIEAGRTTLDEHSFDLHQMLDDVEDMFYLRAADKGLVLLCEYAQDLPQYVRADEIKLRQVLINLLSNAVKFTPKGGVTLRVRCMDVDLEGKARGECRQPTEAARLHFEVEDTGIGIAADDLKALFEPFVQTMGGQVARQGTGLGLPISKQFVQLMGGEITVASVLGQGTVFRFDVQVELTEASEARPEAPTRRVVGLEPDQPVYRLLVVEDRDSNRNLLVKLLTGLSTTSTGIPGPGFEVREAVNGQEAIEIWEAWNPHLIWMDMRMPVMDGHEATKRIKATPKGQNTVIIALTASAFEEDRRRVLAEGCDDFVRKPFHEADIFGKLAQHLQVRFVYKDAREGPARVQDTLPPGALAGLPADWVTSLRQAASRADSNLVLDLVDQIRKERALVADALVSLVRQYRFDLILALTQTDVDQVDEGT